jgi:ribosomal protein S27AE
MEESEYIESAFHLPCQSCGSLLHYEANSQKISCGHCGYIEEIDKSKDKVVEKSLHDAMADAVDFVPEERGKKIYDCGNCGANFMVDSEQVKINCGFCGSTNVNVKAFGNKYIEPSGIIPFYISRFEAEKIFKEWVGSGVIYSSKLKKLDSVEKLHGVYLPFWTFDAQVKAEGSGEAGEYYNDSEKIMVDGEMVHQSDKKKIRWTHKSGKVNHFFDDILVVAADGLKQKIVEKILPFRLGETVNFDPRLMVGWEAEIYNVEVDDGYHRSERIMDDKLRNMCSAQLGGDKQRNLFVKSQKSEQTFKHIILPVWVCSYNYNNKLYHFTINGQTGKVYGKKPYSYWKIVGYVLLIAILIYLTIVATSE